jgi:hypothetical protein
MSRDDILSNISDEVKQAASVLLDRAAFPLA